MQCVETPKFSSRLEKQGRRRERAERKIKKAIDKRDLRRGKKRKAKKEARLLHALRFKPTDPDPERSAEPPPSARRHRAGCFVQSTPRTAASFTWRRSAEVSNGTATPFLWGEKDSMLRSKKPSSKLNSRDSGFPACFLSSKSTQRTPTARAVSSKTRGHRCRRRQNVPI